MKCYFLLQNVTYANMPKKKSSPVHVYSSPVKHRRPDKFLFENSQSLLESPTQPVSHHAHNVITCACGKYCYIIYCHKINLFSYSVHCLFFYWRWYKDCTGYNYCKSNQITQTRFASILWKNFWHPVNLKLVISQYSSNIKWDENPYKKQYF